MRIVCCIFLSLFLSCGQNTKKEKPAGPAEDSATSTTPATGADTVITKPEKPSPPSLAADVNKFLEAKSGGDWVVVDDSAARWPRDEYDYFIAAKRKEDPDYPYIVKGDFDGNGKPDDLAALVKKKKGTECRLALIFGFTPAGGKLNFWKEDMDISALSLYPRGPLEGIDEKKVTMPADGVTVEYFEKSSFVVYWNGKALKRAWTGD